MQLLAPVLLLLSATLASATTEQQQLFKRQMIGSNSTLVIVQTAETGVLRAGSPSPTDIGNRFAGNSGNDFFQVSSASSTVAGILGVIGAVVGGAMLL